VISASWIVDGPTYRTNPDRDNEPFLPPANGCDELDLRLDVVAFVPESAGRIMTPKNAEIIGILNSLLVQAISAEHL
jgi:hypothetical protein